MYFHQSKYNYHRLPEHLHSQRDFLADKREYNQAPYHFQQSWAQLNSVQNSIEPSFVESDMVLDYIRVYQQGSPSANVDVQEACDSYTWIDGNTYTQNNNTASYALTNIEGCDSIVQLDLTINNSSTRIVYRKV